jgi:forkhead box protein K
MDWDYDGFLRPTFVTDSVTDLLSPAPTHLLAIMDALLSSHTSQHSLVDSSGKLSPINTQNPASDKTIAAYYSLIFPTYTFYLQTLTCTIGRRTVATSGPSVDDSFKVDVDLGPLKSVSRLHAKIEYDNGVESFVISVIGRNGAWIDGVWAKAGSRVALGEHTQIQIASRIFQFVLPPTPLPQDDNSTPSPPSSSGVRGRSPSLDIDITSISPASSPPHSPQPNSGFLTPRPKHHGPPTTVEPPDPPHLDLDVDLDIEEDEEEVKPSPPPRTSASSLSSKTKGKAKPEPPSSPKLPNSNSIQRHTSKSAKPPPANPAPSEDIAGPSSNSKKRKKATKPQYPDPSWTRPAPEDMPPKPSYTYAQLIYRAIKSIGTKATLQEICNWIMTEYDYYKWADGAWMSSVRHNLSSSKAFKKLERCGGDRGKGFFWSVEEALEHTFIEQEAKMNQAASQSSQNGTKGGKKKGGAPLTDPPLKRSVKGDKGQTPLPPPLTSVPLVMKSALNNTHTNPTSSYPIQTPIKSSALISSAATPSNPPQWGQYSHQAQVNTQQQSSTSSSVTSPSVVSPPLANTTPTPAPGGTAAAAQAAVAQFSASIAFLDSNARVPIVIGLPPNVQAAASPPLTKDPSTSSLSFTTPPMSLHNHTIHLDPSVFGHLTPEQLAGLEALGMQKSLELLRSYMARFLKEKMGKKKKSKKKDKGDGTSKEKDKKKNDREVRQGTADTVMKDAEAAGQGPSTPTPGSAFHPNVTQVAADKANAPSNVPREADVDPGSPILIIDDDEEEQDRLAKRPRFS